MKEQVIRAEKVQAALKRLRALGIHSHGHGYLAVAYTKGKIGRAAAPKDVEAFFDEFLKVPEVATKYLVLFPSSRMTDRNWAYENPQGSFTQSSVREGPLREVMSVEGSGKAQRLVLKKGHESLAREHICKLKDLPALDLATVLWRDAVLETKRGMTPAKLVQLFQAEFGYLDDKGRLSEGFADLYEVPADLEKLSADHWFEKFREV